TFGDFFIPSAFSYSELLSPRISSSKTTARYGFDPVKPIRSRVPVPRSHCASRRLLSVRPFLRLHFRSPRWLPRQSPQERPPFRPPAQALEPGSGRALSPAPLAGPHALPDPKPEACGLARQPTVIWRLPCADLICLTSRPTGPR